MHELELKFQILPSVLSSLVQAMHEHGARTAHLVARYFDTPDGALARNGIALRLRRERGRWVQAVKVQVGDSLERLEHEVPLRERGRAVPASDVARHDGTPAGARLREALGAAGAGPLDGCWTTDVLRRACLVRQDGSAIELALDVGLVAAGARSAPLAEVEFELKSGSPDALFALARAWCGHGGLWLDVRSKAQRGAALAAGREHAEPLHSRVPALDPAMNGTQLQRAVLRAVLEQVLANASEVAAGSTDDEHVHQLRVGLRRLRTALRELPGLGAGLPATGADAIARTFEVLGNARDERAVAQAVRPLLERARAPAADWIARPRVVPAAAAAVCDPAFQLALLDLLCFAHDDTAAAGGLPAPLAREHLARRLARAHGQVVRDGRRFAALPIEAQHRLRKRLKRLRYLAEFVQTLWPAKSARRYLRQLGPAQDALGHHNDVAVACERFRQDAAADPRAWFAAGWLQAHGAVTAAAAQRALEPLLNAPRFWKR
jgi:inorganic triphosphatase YgiF